MDPSFVPVGSDRVARWARARGLGYEPRPNRHWFHEWEPFDAITSPTAYLNACSWDEHPGGATIVEPWTEDGLHEPMDRTILAFVRHPELTVRASMHAGEFFITRVSFLTDPPPPIVKLGDERWDDHVVTRAKSVHDAQRAFPSSLRDLLRRWGYQGHIEFRPGGMILHFADLKPTDQHYDAMSKRVPMVVNAALGHPQSA
jgi:hypothetical protein